MIDLSLLRLGWSLYDVFGCFEMDLLENNQLFKTKCTSTTNHSSYHVQCIKNFAKNGQVTQGAYT